MTTTLKRIEAADVKAAAAGQWTAILATCGVPIESLNPKRHVPCPKCGGKDRFRVFDDFEQTGGCYCNQCHKTNNSDGISTIMWLCDCDFRTALGKLAKHLGMTTRNGSDKGTRRIVATYDYRDADGKLSFQVVRLDPKDFRQRRPGADGEWLYDLEGVTPVLYRLPELLAGDPCEWTFLVEGEEDVDRLRGAGQSATCNPMGAGKWKDEYSDTLANRKIAILADNDPAGWRHAAKAAASLDGKAAAVKVIELPGLPEKGDVSAWLNAGGTADELLAIVEAATPYRRKSNLPVASLKPGIANVITTGGEEGDARPATMAELLEAVDAATGDWPRRVGPALFVHDEDSICWLENTSALFGWLSAAVGQVTWSKRIGCVTKPELFAELKRSARNYSAVAVTLHWMACDLTHAIVKKGCRDENAFDLSERLDYADDTGDGSLDHWY